MNTERKIKIALHATLTLICFSLLYFVGINLYNPLWQELEIFQYIVLSMFPIGMFCGVETILFTQWCMEDMNCDHDY